MSDRPPNLLFIFTDQQRVDTLGCYDNPLVQTPNLDRLAAQSFVFERAYVTQPVCTPSRASIMTGLYPHTCGCVANNVALRPETPTLAEMVAGDYTCAYYGKWHLGDEIIRQHGFDDWLSVSEHYRSHYSRPEYLALFSDYHRYLAENGFQPDREWYGARIYSGAVASRVPEQFTRPRFQARHAVRFIREHRDRPFILYVNFIEPHRPYYSPFDDLYPPQAVPVGPHFRQRPPENAALITRLLADMYTRRGTLDDADLTVEAGCRRLRARYLGMVTLVDRAVGEILRALEEAGLSDRTIVVFTSDHGDLVGDHGLWGKSCMYEEALRVPMMLRVPWLGGEQRRIASRISQIHLVPTLLELLGQRVPAGLEGVSCLPLLTGQATLAELGQDDVFVEWHGTDGWPKRNENPQITADQGARVLGPWRTVITSDGWKLNLSPVDQCELYDLNNDPFEQRNLFDEPGERARVRDLAGRIRAWQRRTADTARLPEL